MADATCPDCYDTDGGQILETKGTCYDTVGGLCTGSGCTDVCASSGSVTEYYCSGTYAQKSCMPTTKSCSGGDICRYGACVPNDGGGGGGGAGGCSWYSSAFGVCSSGCPASYPNQQYVCCASAGSGCNPGTSGCASYDPLKGETPCCTASSYYTCTKQETCTEGGCQNVCAGADKTSELYCSKCNSCQDGVQNCGEPGVDVCSTEPCTITTTTEYTKWSPSQCRDVCRNDGATCVAVQGTSGDWYPQGCSDGWTGNCKCSKTTTGFNPKTCSDGFQNCGEVCVDGGAQCNAGAKETDNSYLVAFEYGEPSPLTGTKFYSDANSWNCADGVDNDRDCLVDCADPDCSSSLACNDISPPAVSVGGAPAGWQKTAATASVICSDDAGGCDSGTYRLKTYSSNPGACSNAYADYTLANPSTIPSHAWVCGTAKDTMGNAGYSTSPAEFKVDTAPPQVNIYGVPYSPCTLDPVKQWIDCSASPSLNSYPPDGCVDADSGCNPSSYGFKAYYADPVNCPAAKSSYSSAPPVITNLSWVCGYAEDNVGNFNATAFKFLVNRTFTITIDAKAYGEIDVPAGSEVKAYLCDPSQYYCNQDAQYMASSSGTVGADKRFKITFVRDLARGTAYKIGLQTEKGYAESEFVA